LIFEAKMGMIMKSFMCLSLVFVLALMPVTSAFAIDGDKAIELCNKNKRCKHRIQTDGSIVIVVDGSIIMCPLIGECQCTQCPGPAKTVKPGKSKNIMSVPKLLQQTVAP
jgi:hypothetical protein